MSGSLKARLQRLEKQQRTRPMPRFVFRLCPQEDAGEIVAFQAGNLHIIREAGEPEETCAARAFELSGATHIVAIHAGRAKSAVEAAERASATLTGSEASADCDAPEIDPFALAGIGRMATREELIEMGAIPVPPERLI